MSNTNRRRGTADWPTGCASVSVTNRKATSAVNFFTRKTPQKWPLQEESYRHNFISLPVTPLSQRHMLALDTSLVGSLHHLGTGRCSASFLAAASASVLETSTSGSTPMTSHPFTR